MVTAGKHTIETCNNCLLSFINIVDLNIYILAGPGGTFGCASDWRLAGRTGDQEVAASTPIEVGNILSWRLIMKYFYGYSLPSADSRRAVVSFWLKNVHNTG